ncbi:MAG: OsmC family protein [Candidatus Schekmanbacteria bacterium]|nr:OsmC family protein [Candidatus Schekmanbacteria bacterium]
MDMTFRIESAGGVASTVQLGRHQLLFDQPRSAGGDGRGPSPLAVFAAAAGACVHYYVAAFLRQRELATDGLAVEVVASKAEEGPARLHSFSLRVELPEGVPEKYRPAIERVAKQCPVHGTLAHSPALDIEVVAPVAA